MRRFEAAPLTLKLKAISVFASAVLAAIMLTAPGFVLHPGQAPAQAVIAVLLAGPPIIIATALLFVVRGYELDGAVLGVRRLLWTTRVPIDGLQRAWHDPKAMQRSTRIFGNSGLFSVTGHFRNRTLGSYRAFVTDPARAVAIRLAARVIVVSPADPAALVAALESHHAGR